MLDNTTLFGRLSVSQQSPVGHIIQEGSSIIYIYMFMYIYIYMFMYIYIYTHPYRQINTDIHICRNFVCRHVGSRNGDAGRNGATSGAERRHWLLRCVCVCIYIYIYISR